MHLPACASVQGAGRESCPGLLENVLFFQPLKEWLSTNTMHCVGLEGAAKAGLQEPGCGN